MAARAGIEPGGIETEWSDIAVDSALQFSGQGPFGPTARAFKELSARFKNLASPAVISTLVVRALAAKRPKTRYAAGTAAFPLLLLRRVLIDRGYDRLLRLLMRSTPQGSAA